MLPAGGDSDGDLEIGHAPLSAADCKEQKKAKRPDGVAIPLESDEDETSMFTLGQSSQMRRRRKRAARVVSSDSERDDDDVPLSRLRRMSHLIRRPVPDTPVMSRAVDGDNSRNFTPRRRLQRLADIGGNKVSGKCSEKSENSILEDEMEGDDDSSSLDGFIVDDSNCNDMCMSEHDDGSLSGGDSESVSEGSMGYPEIMSGLGRERKDKGKWEHEADMLADFGKSDELCMKAVCVLYRQQTSEEKSYRATINRNGRGFSQFHAFSGAALAEFLTDGGPHGDVNKTVEELLNFNPDGVEECHKLANHYSKQLFEIYKNEEDLFFHP